MKSRFWESTAAGTVTDFSLIKGDASARAYFRLLRRDGKNEILVQYPRREISRLKFDLEISAWLRAAGLSTPRVYESSVEDGWAVLEDFGDRDAAEVLEELQLGERLSAALHLIDPLRQLADLGRYPSLPGGRILDLNRLRWELAGFELWFIRYVCARDVEPEISAWFDALAYRVAKHPYRVCHRDYHLNNLFFIGDDEVGVIDAQDALLGPDTYDAVSLLEERDMPSLLPDGEKEKWKVRWAAETGALPGWRERFGDVRLQRGFKVIGTFARLGLCGVEGYEHWLKDLVKELTGDLDSAKAPPALRLVLLDWMALGGRNAG